MSCFLHIMAGRASTLLGSRLPFTTESIEELGKVSSSSDEYSKWQCTLYGMGCWLSINLILGRGMSLIELSIVILLKPV